MFFTVNNNQHVPQDYLYRNTMLDAYYIVRSYPFHATEILMERYIQQQYKISLKDMCVKLLLNLTHYNDDSGNIILMFKDPKLDKIARLITYGNGAIPGSKILQSALKY